MPCTIPRTMARSTGSGPFCQTSKRAPLRAVAHGQVRSLGHARQEGEQEVLELGVVLLEHPHDLGVGHRLDPGHALQADVVVGDQRDVHVAELELAGEQGLGVAGHVDDLPAVALEPPGLGPGGEAGALDDHHGAAVVGGDALGLGLLEGEGAQLGAVGVGEGDVGGLGAVVEGVVPAPGPVHHLVADDEVPGGGLGLERPGGAGADHPGHPQLLHRPEVGPVGDLVGRVLVAAAVAGEEGHPAALDLADRDLVGRGAIGRLDLVLLHAVEERVEPGATEDPELGLGTGHDARTFRPAGRPPARRPPGSAAAGMVSEGPGRPASIEGATGPAEGQALFSAALGLAVEFPPSDDGLGVRGGRGRVGGLLGLVAVGLGGLPDLPRESVR